jgi:branched-chain amino acid transport system permease protein
MSAHPVDKVRIRRGTMVAGIVVFTMLALGPMLVAWLDKPFYLDLLMRLMIIGIAAMSLNLILGYGGMVSFGHAAFLGIGAYAVGIPAYYGEYNGLAQLTIAVVAGGAFAFLTGLVCLRTRGVYFIMITLAFAQMVFFAFVSIEEYGGDDGLVIDARSELGLGIDLENNVHLYYVVLCCTALVMYAIDRIVHSRFGMVVQGSQENDGRMQAVGFNTFRYRLVCYVLAGMICSLAGWLLANFTSFISPDMMDWTRSGELIFMVVLGGTATALGPLLGAGAFILVEELLSGWTVYWQLPFGALLILVVLFLRGGIHGWIARGERR